MTFRQIAINCFRLSHLFYDLMSTRNAIVIRKFEFKIDKKIDVSEIKVTVNVTLEPVNPVKIRIEKKNV